jgi:hypothetical protein
MLFPIRNNDQFMVAFSRIAIVDKMSLFSFPANWKKFPDENSKFTRNKLEFYEKLKTFFFFTTFIYCQLHSIILPFLYYLVVFVFRPI